MTWAIVSCHLSGIPLQKGFFPLSQRDFYFYLIVAKGKLFTLKGKKNPAHMTWAIDIIPPFYSQTI
jgi:hypothetical protein